VGLANLFGQLAAPGKAIGADPGVAQALVELFAAGTAHPELVGGQGRLDTSIMRALPGAVFAKIGAMGVYGLAVAPCARYPEGLGVGVKVLDGDFSGRVLEVVVPEILIQLGLLDPQAAASLLVDTARATLNNRGVCVGDLSPCFEL